MAKKTEETLPAVVENAEVATGSIPEWMQEDSVAMSNAGLEEIKSGDMTIPRLALAQSTSDEQKEGHTKYIEGLKAGQFFNTLTKEIYGKGPLLITPLFMKRHRRLFTPRDQGSATLCISDNGITVGAVGKKLHAPTCANCPKSQFSTDASGKPVRPECTLFYSYVVVLHLGNSRFMPMMLSLKSKMVKSAQDWNALMRLRQTAAFTGVYTVESFLDNAAAGNFYNLRIANRGIIEDKTRYEEAKDLFNALRDKIDTVVRETVSTNDDEVVDAEEVPF